MYLGLRLVFDSSRHSRKTTPGVKHHQIHQEVVGRLRMAIGMLICDAVSGSLFDLRQAHSRISSAPAEAVSLRSVGIRDTWAAEADSGRPRTP